MYLIATGDAYVEERGGRPGDFGAAHLKCGTEAFGAQGKLMFRGFRRGIESVHRVIGHKSDVFNHGLTRDNIEAMERKYDDAESYVLEREMERETEGEERAHRAFVARSERHDGLRW